MYMSINTITAVSLEVSFTEFGRKIIHQMPLVEIVSRNFGKRSAFWGRQIRKKRKSRKIHMN